MDDGLSSTILGLDTVTWSEARALTLSIPHALPMAIALLATDAAGASPATLPLRLVDLEPRETLLFIEKQPAQDFVDGHRLVSLFNT
ncbi:hypothetical protein GUJ93_ZPchr0009g1529 [Zizania palustris]|uniref:Uncharacterized protein n=1 Tax=Zizania palustris TaxID=103762 RepID=A0A8J5V993_ZIZPA|nr:hypothetical protein GUJ93_ZPchr0009g1529 [Zizania palustris]